jgi:hypothetical protein
VHAAVALFPAPPLHANPLLADSSPCPQCEAKPAKQGAAQLAQRVQDAAGISLGPIGLTIGSDLGGGAASSGDEDAPPAPSISSISTEEWRERYEADGRVDLWVKEEFNSGKHRPRLFAALSSQQQIFLVPTLPEAAVPCLPG